MKFNGKHQARPLERRLHALVRRLISEHLRVAPHLRHRSRIVLPSLELVWRHLEIAELFLVVTHHVPEAAHFALSAETALVARGYFGGVENCTQVTHFITPSLDRLLETAHGVVFALSVQGRYHKQQGFVLQQVLQMVETPDAGEEHEHPGSNGTSMDR